MWIVIFWQYFAVLKSASPDPAIAYFLACLCESGDALHTAALSTHDRSTHYPAILHLQSERVSPLFCLPHIAVVATARSHEKAFIHSFKFEMSGVASIRAKARACSPEHSLRRDSGHVVSCTQKRSGYLGNGGGTCNGTGNVSGCKHGQEGSHADAKGKKPWKSICAPWHDGAGPSSGGSNGGGDTLISEDEMRARYLARVCQFCGTRGHQRKDCSHPKPS